MLTGDFQQFDHTRPYPATPPAKVNLAIAGDTQPYQAQVLEYVQPSSFRKNGLHEQGKSDRAAAVYGMGKPYFDWLNGINRN